MPLGLAPGCTSPGGLALTGNGLSLMADADAQGAAAERLPSFFQKKGKRSACPVIEICLIRYDVPIGTVRRRRTRVWRNASRSPNDLRRGPNGHAGRDF